MSYHRVPQPQVAQFHTWDQDSAHYGSNNSYQGAYTYTNQNPHQAPTYYAEPEKYTEPGKAGINVTERPVLNGRASSGFSLKLGAAPAWQHNIHKKHTGDRPAETDTVRYFDRSRQTRRVLISCLKFWLISAMMCAGIVGVLYYYSRIRPGITQLEKYSFNTAVLLLSIFLGIAISAEFKNHCEIMRWRFLASTYRKLNEFEDVLGCDSWRSTLSLIFKGRKGQWYPSKAQILAFAWLLIFLIFNVVAALIGLTMSIDLSTDTVMLKEGNTSVVELAYIARSTYASPEDVHGSIEDSSANLYGQVGQGFTIVNYSASIDQKTIQEPVIFFDPVNNNYGYHFVDQGQKSARRKTSRSITSTATCQEYDIITEEIELNAAYIEWVDSRGYFQNETISNYATSATTWMNNDTASRTCGERCAELLVYQVANGDTIEEGVAGGHSGVPVSRLFGCNNTVSEVIIPVAEQFDDPEKLAMPRFQAWLLAGAIGLTGISSPTNLQYCIIQGDWTYSPPGNNSASDFANLIMRFTAGAIAAMDQRGGPRKELMSTVQPNPAQIVNVKWPYAIAILGGIPTVQMLILIAVVRFSGKAIIREPSALMTAQLFYPVIHKLGHKGVLMSTDEITERMGPDFRVAYTVRPDPRDPGHHDTSFVRNLDLVDEREGFGYIRGKMPEGRYD